MRLGVGVIVAFKDSDWYRDAQDKEDDSIFNLVKAVVLLAILSLSAVVGILIGLMR